MLFSHLNKQPLKNKEEKEVTRKNENEKSLASKSFHKKYFQHSFEINLVAIVVKQLGLSVKVFYQPV